jgi:hypothetical protein
MGRDNETHKAMTEKIVEARACVRVLITMDFAEPRGTKAQADSGLDSPPDCSNNIQLTITVDNDNHNLFFFF